MGFSIATYNVRDLLDDEALYLLGAPEGEELTAAEREAARAVYGAKLETIALQLRRLDADVVGFQEVGSARVLDELRALLPPRNGVAFGGYGPAVAASADRRGIACGLLSRFPITASRDHVATDLAFPVFVAGDPSPYPARLGTHRGVLEAVVALPDGTTLTAIVLHLKSNIPAPLLQTDGSAIPFTDHRAYAEGMTRSLVTRVAEALFVRSLVDATFDATPDAQLVVMGDFNDGEQSVPVRAVMGDLVLAGRYETHPGSRLRGRALYPCARAVAPDARNTLLYRGAGQQIDHLLASRALWSRFRGARVLNETLREDSAGSGPLALESDHAPLRAEFE